MIKIFKWITPVLLGVVMFSSCGEEDKTENLKHSTGYNMISSIDHLALVGSIDLISLIEKSGFEANPDLPMEASAGYKMMIKDKLDAEKTGIDLTGNNHFAISMVEADEPEYVMFTAKVTNPENAKATVQDLLKGDYSTEEVDGDNYEFVVEDEVAVAWDANDLVIVFSEDQNAKDIAKELLQARYVDGPDEDNGMEAYLEQADDMNAYVRVENSVDFLEAQNTDIPEEFLGALEGAYYIGTGNFNNGDIVFEWNIHAEGVKNSEFNALAADAIHESFMDYLTNDKLIAFGTASVNMDAIFHAIEYAQNEEFSFEDIEEETGLSREMMQEMFTGEFAISFADIIQEEVVIEASEDDFFEDSYSYSSEVPLVIFTAGIGDSTQIGEFLRMTGKAEINNGVYKMDKNAFVVMHGDKLILTSHQATAEQLATGMPFKTYTIPTGASTGKPLFGYVNTDLTQIPEGLMKMASNEEGEMALEFMGLFESVQFNGEFERMEFRAAMNNKTDNSLKVITDFVLKLVKEKQMI
jgi:hypothetical protein